MDRQSTSSKPPMSQGFLPILQNPRFLTLWVGQIFSQLADKVYLVLMIALIAGHFQGENQPISGWVSAIMIAFTIPAVLFGSFAGVYIDRWSKKGVLVISNFVRGALVFVIPPLIWLSQDQTLALPVSWLPVWLRQWQFQVQDNFFVPLGFLFILTLTFVDSTITQFFAPAEQVTIPLIVERRHLLSANSLFTTTMMAMTIIGFAIGDPLLELAATLAKFVGLSWEFGKSLVVALSYLLAGFILIFLRTGEKREHYEKERSHILKDIRDGLHYLNNNHRVRNALIQLVILFCIFAALSVLAVRMAETIPGLKAEQFGFLLAFGGLGMAFGAGILGNWGQQFSKNQLGLWGSLGMTVSLVGLSLSIDNLWLTLLMTTFLGLFAAFVGVPMQTVIQSETPVDMRGKVFGLQNNAVNIALSLPLALAGIAETLVGLKPVLLALAGLAVAGGILTRNIGKNESGNKKSEL
ncbi:major facilitator superfamily protein [cyanobacterium endosymbiont of Rhopalodia gibberula]|uniref:MFS transporter n=1 Tax=cyanobacterium endosymbiont of Rhopalodia gibberula TaxID=1763363 RepID=UPI000DC721C1|nr:MFS transporter [cyanobacterium endosymbiont of Rhopalodia gibberula]BBA79009.1 major facilitator superfamily protein [cyanobacterium endosymbiont of Rhopalodia gibberula]